MSIAIYKYPIQCNSTREGFHKIQVEMPWGAVPLCVQNQNGQVCIWAEVVKGRKPETFTFVSVGTGFGKVPINGVYLGTVQQDVYVWHIYRIEGKEPL